MKVSPLEGKNCQGKKCASYSLIREINTTGLGTQPICKQVLKFNIITIGQFWVYSIWFRQNSKSTEFNWFLLYITRNCQPELVTNRTDVGFRLVWVIFLVFDFFLALSSHYKSHYLATQFQTNATLVFSEKEV